MLGLFLVFGLFHGSATILGSDRGQRGILIGILVVAATAAAEWLLLGRQRGAVRRLGLGRPRTKGIVVAGGAAFLLLMVGFLSRRRRQREAVLSSPFPQSWTEYLETRCEHYNRLPTAHRDRFRQQVQVFLSEKRITGVEIDVDDETRLLVAASAISLTVGWPRYTWDQLAEVLLYPDNFDRDYNFGGADLSGRAHPWGIVILSVPALSRSFDEASGYHVGFHEFAHLLDLLQGRFDGIPSGLNDDSIRRWTTIVQNEEDRLRGGIP